MPIINCQDWGQQPYADAWQMQEQLRHDCISQKIDNTIIFVEHNPVFTLGKQPAESDFISSKEVIASQGIDIIKTNRGGRITYHGPGQLICYFILRLSDFNMGVRAFVAALENSVIELLAKWQLKGMCDSQYPGVWIGKNKITAIGLNINHGITQHGMAINVNCDLSAYQHIVACGIHDRGITSFKNELEYTLDMVGIKKELANCLESSLKCKIVFT